MQRRLVFAAAAVLCACDPNIPKEEPTAVITARFDPSASPAVVPTPNDLATDRETGLLAVPIPATATGADLAFYEYLNSLNGFPTSAGATATFDGDLQTDSVTSTSVKVYDVTANHAAVTTTPVYSDGDVEVVKGTIAIPPPAGGWTPGHTYAVGLVTGTSGLKSASGAPVVGSATWTFLRSETPLVKNCTDLTSTDCKPATEIIPSAEKEDPAARYADQTGKAIALEQLRLKYKPTIEKLIADGAKREEIVLAWTFKITDYAQVVFDPAAVPPKVPTPNDLAIDRMTGLVKAPIDPSYSDAYKEFITDYLNTLDGFPTSATATAAVAGGDLDPTTVTTDSVLVLALDGEAAPEANVSWSDTSKTITVSPAAGSWGKGRQLAVVVLGRQAADVGAEEPPDAVERVGGGAVVASSVWAIVRSSAPLVSCPNDDLTSPGCALAITAAPLTVGQAISLETLRRLYQPVLDAVVEAGHSRSEVAIAWTFRTVSLPEATFDPAASVIPFPNNVLRTQPPNPHLNLPVPDGGSMLQQNLVTGLNTLDGFSLTAPIVSESSETRGALDIGELDPDTLDAGTGFIRLNAGIAPRVTRCINCASSLLPDGGTPASPEQLQFVPSVPLDEQAPYGAWLTTNLKDLDGHRVIASSAFALARLNNPLCVGGASTVPVVSTAQACGVGGAPGLEQLRLGMKPFIDALVLQGITRTKISLAWAFTTQSTVSELTSLAGAVPTLTTLLPTAVTAAPVPVAAVFPAALPRANLAANLYLGTMTLPFGLTGPGGTIRPPNNWQAQRAAYMLTIPSTPPPTSGYPVIIFGHGLTGNRTTVVAIANSFAAKGFATLAVDVVWHGERNTCAGSGAAIRQMTGNMTATDDYACASPADNTTPDPVNARCDATTGRCVARTGTGTACASDVQCMLTNQGYCVAGNCEGADFARNASKQPLINAWNFLNLQNLFAARDNFRHYAIDLAQVVRVIKADAFMAAGGPDLDGTIIHYAGMSLGGFNGALFAATNTDVQNVLLNVPGADQTGVLLTSPGFASQRNGFLAQLAPLGLTPGTPGFDQLMVLIRTIFDRSDPQNFGLTAVNINLPATRKVFIQSITNDFVVPNATTDKLIAGATSGAKMPYQDRVNPTLVADPMAGACMPAAGSLCASSRHGFLLNFVDPGTTAAAQAKAATFMETGVVP